MKLLQYPLLLAAIFALSSCSSQPEAVPVPESPLDPDAGVSIKKSPNDDRQYRYLVLENQLRVLLVQDAQTDKAAASLTVLRGSYNEPDEYPGLAHFLEHMLFIGTEKYPQVDGYQQFISSHGGSSNAYTAAEVTNYFFDIQPEYFQDGMDRFSQFFISPLLDADYVEREKNAVNSEYQMQIKDDGWRGFSVLKSTMDPAYPGSRFTIGSLETLNEGVDEALKAFFETNYSADQMVLVALSSAALDEMEAWIRPMFGQIANHQIGPAPLPPKAFGTSQLPAVLSYQTLKDGYQLSFNFPIPATDPYYRTKPAEYLTNLIGHEGEGSLYQALKSKGWIESLAAGVNRVDRSNAFLSINIELTESGHAAIDEVGGYIFSYIELLEVTAPEAWRYNEQATAASLAFRFQEKSSATGFVYRTAPAMALYPPEDLLIAPYLMEGFDAGLIKNYLTYLTAENVIVEVAGPDVETDQVEVWFAVPYKLEQRPPSVNAPDQADLHLPVANPFLTDDLDLLAGDPAGPELVIEQQGLEIWLDEDVEFGAPRANQYYILGVEGGLLTPRNIVIAQLHQRLVNDALSQYTYPAMLAGVGYQISINAAGFRISLVGYSDKQAELMDAVLREFTSVYIDPDRFHQYKEELVRDWSNFVNERPYTQTYSALNNLFISSSFDRKTLADTLKTVKFRDLRQWRREKLDKIMVVGLAHGNVDAQAVQNISRQLAERLPLANFPLSQNSVLDIEEPWLLELTISHDDASMVLYVQDEDSTFESRARSALATQILRQAYFSDLRTEQQLGYVVAMSNRTLIDRSGLAFIIQSPVASPADLELATLNFMLQQQVAMKEMTAETFEQQKSSLISQLTERDKNLQQRTRRYWSDLELEILSFDSRQQIADIIQTLTRQQMTSYLESVVTDLTRKRVLIYSLGKFNDAPTLGTLLPDAGALKAVPST